MFPYRTVLYESRWTMVLAKLSFSILLLRLSLVLSSVWSLIWWWDIPIPSRFSCAGTFLVTAYFSNFPERFCSSESFLIRYWRSLLVVHILNLMKTLLGKSCSPHFVAAAFMNCQILGCTWKDLLLYGCILLHPPSACGSSINSFFDLGIVWFSRCLDHFKRFDGKTSHDLLAALNCECIVVFSGDAAF